MIFAEQNVLKDPPFSKLNFVSCRDLLIHLNADLQKRVVDLFHYALVPGGILFLGNSETTGERPLLFETLDRKGKLYVRKLEDAAPAYSLIEELSPVPAASRSLSALPQAKSGPSLREITARSLLSHFSRAAVLVDGQGEILYFHGRTDDLAPVGYVTVDESGIILQANLRATTLLSVTRAALVGRRFVQMIAAQGQDQYYLARKRMLQTGELMVCELKMVKLENPPFCARLEMSRALEKGAQVSLIAIVDITDRHCLEEALREANAQLSLEKQIAEEAIAAKSQFLSAMSHEIRTPLNGVVGMAGLLLQANLNPEQLSYARIVADSGEALLGLVNNIVDFSKIEAGALELDETAFDLECLTEDVLDLMSFKAHEKSLELACWYPSGVPCHFTGDSGRLRQVLMNLLSKRLSSRIRAMCWWR